MLFSLAWKNLWRHKIRSAVLIMSIAFGLQGGIFSMGMVFGMLEQIILSAINTQLSHIQIHENSFVENPDIKGFINNSEKIFSEFKNHKLVKGISGRQIVTGIISSPRSSSSVNIYGINPEDESKVSDIFLKIKDGTPFQGNCKNQVLIGEELSKRLKTKLNSKVVFTFQNIESDITGAAFRVKGIFKTDNSVYDGRNVLVKLNSLEKHTGLSERFHEIAILLNESKDIEYFSTLLKDIFPSKKIQTWKEIAPEYDYMVEIDRVVMYIFIGIILFALAFGIINTMLMAVLERKKELGVLIALGMNKRTIFLMIILETMFLTLAGAALGCPVPMVYIKRCE